MARKMTPEERRANETFKAISKPLKVKSIKPKGASKNVKNIVKIIGGPEERRRKRAAQLAKTLNERLRKAEKSGLQGTTAYKELNAIVKDVNKITGAKGKRFKSRYAKTADSVIRDVLPELEKAMTITDILTGSKASKAYRDVILDRMSGGRVDRDTLSEMLGDILEFQKSSIYQKLKEFYDSDEINEMITLSKKSRREIEQMFEEYQDLRRGKEFDVEEFRDWVISVIKPV